MHAIGDFLDASFESISVNEVHDGWKKLKSSKAKEPKLTEKRSKAQEEIVIV